MTGKTLSQLGVFRNVSRRPTPLPLRTSACRTPPRPVLDEREIRDFLTGKTDGEDLLHALYDHVLDEPVPERLTALLKR